MDSEPSDRTIDSVAHFGPRVAVPSRQVACRMPPSGRELPTCVECRPGSVVPYHQSVDLRLNVETDASSDVLPPAGGPARDAPCRTRVRVVETPCNIESGTRPVVEDRRRRRLPLEVRFDTLPIHWLEEVVAIDVEDDGAELRRPSEIGNYRANESERCVMGVRDRVRCDQTNWTCVDQLDFLEGNRSISRCGGPTLRILLQTKHSARRIRPILEKEPCAEGRAGRRPRYREAPLRLG
jgi:hypothetical protein